MHLEFLKRFYPDFKDKKILELGCGRGDFLLECYTEGLDVIGIDINPEYIKISEEKIKKSGFKPHIILAKGEELPFEDNDFDFINCVEVLEHTNDPKKVLMECYRVLKDNGQIFITIHNRFGAKDAHYKLWFLNWLPKFLKNKYIKLMGKEKEKQRHSGAQGINEMHYFTYKIFKKMVQKIGFSTKDTREFQIYNSELVLKRKNQEIVNFFKKIKLSFILIGSYKILNLFYFNTFHFIMTK